VSVAIDHPQVAGNVNRLDTIRMSKVVPKAIVPIWPGVLYQGKVTVVAGVPGDGKSLGSEDIAARISMGKAWPCGDGQFKRGNVLLLTAEDDPADTIRPRLDVAGADCEAIELIQGAYHEDQSTGQRALNAVSLIDDLPAIEDRILAINARLLIIDPLTSFATSDTNKTADMRRLFDSIAQMAARTEIAILVITHMNKRSDARKAMQMIAGSHVIVAAVRVALVTARDPNDKARRLLLPIKLNIAADEGGFAFKIVGAAHPICGDVPRVEWESGRVVDVSADDALIDSTPRAQAAVEKSCEVQSWLRELLHGGPAEARLMWNEAKGKGFGERRVKTALKAIKATCEVLGYQGKWHYRLPVSDISGVSCPSV
jgi:putative DNA primase/helicase